MSIFEFRQWVEQSIPAWVLAVPFVLLALYAIFQDEKPPNRMHRGTPIPPPSPPGLRPTSPPPPPPTQRERRG